MDLLKRIAKRAITLGKWVWRMWPVLVPVSIGGLHILAANHSPTIDWGPINKLLYLLLQLAGGFVVLITLDSSLGLINKTSIPSIFISYLKSFPLIKREHKLTVDFIDSKTDVLSAKVRLSGSKDTVEEKIAHLQKQIECVKEDLNDEMNYLKQLISTNDKQNQKSLSEIRRTIGTMDNTIKLSTLSSLKWQLLGVLLIFYGSIVSYFI